MRWAMSDGETESSEYEEYEDDVAEQSTSDERTWRSSPEDNLLRAWEHIQALIHWNGDIVSQFSSTLVLYGHCW
jgi:hypothetical protein